MTVDDDVAVKVGQVWAKDGTDIRVEVVEQYLDKGTLEDMDDWKVRNLETRRTHWVFGFNLRRIYTLEPESEPS